MDQLNRTAPQRRPCACSRAATALERRLLSWFRLRNKRRPTEAEGDVIAAAAWALAGDGVGCARGCREATGVVRLCAAAA